MIDVILLGTGGMMPLANRWLSSALIRCDGELTLFDCGEGTQIPWRTFGWGFRGLSTICLSHVHADHVTGLPGVLFSAANAERTDPITIYGPAGMARVVRGLLEVAPRLPFEMRITEIEPGIEFSLPGRMSLVVGAGDHRDPCYYYRVDRPRDRRFNPQRAIDMEVPVEFWRRLQHGESITYDGRRLSGEDFLGPERPGVSLAYVTDTRPVKPMKQLLSGVDLLICEGTYADSSDQPKAIEKKHMTFSEAAELASGCDAGSLWLTHFSPAVASPADFASNATGIFPNATIGYSGLTTTLSFPEDGGDY